MITTDTIKALSARKDKSLRVYQHDNKMKIYEAWKECNSVMLQMPTGTGKTKLFVSIIKDFCDYEKGGKKPLRILVLVHREELIIQTMNDIKRCGIRCGKIKAGEKEVWRWRVQVASVATLTRGKRLGKWSEKDFDLIIVDEAHHILAESYQRVIEEFPNAKLLGVTATPCRTTGKGFNGVIERLIVSDSTKLFIENKFLSPYVYYSIPNNSRLQQEINDIESINAAGDYDEAELINICDVDSVRANVVNTYLEHANGLKGIVFAINRQHCINLTRKFNECGVAAEYIDSRTKPEERKKLLERFKKGELKVLCNINIFTEGYDCPDMEFVQLARPTQSLSLYLQQVGRALRYVEGKKAIILDNVGLYNRFGFPDANRRWKHHFEGSEADEIKANKSKFRGYVFPRASQEIFEGSEKVILLQTADEEEYVKKYEKGLLEIYNEIVTRIDECYARYKKVWKKSLMNLKVIEYESHEREEDMLFFRPLPFTLDRVEEYEEYYKETKVDKDGVKLFNIEHFINKTPDSFLEFLFLHRFMDVIGTEEVSTNGKWYFAEPLKNFDKKHLYDLLYVLAERQGYTSAIESGLEYLDGKKSNTVSGRKFLVHIIDNEEVIWLFQYSLVCALRKVHKRLGNMKKCDLYTLSDTIIGEMYEGTRYAFMVNIKNMLVENAKKQLKDVPENILNNVATEVLCKTFKLGQRYLDAKPI